MTVVTSAIPSMSNPEVGGVDPFPQRLAAVDEERGAGDVPGLVRGEEGDGGGDVLRLPDAAERDARGELGEESLLVSAFLLAEAQLRLDDAGADGVGADAEGGDLERQRLGHRFDGGLAGHVGGAAGDRVVAAGGGAHVDDGAAPGPRQGGRRRTCSRGRRRAD